MERRQRPPGGAEGVLLAVVVVAGAALRWRWLGQPIRYDEAVTWLEYASRPLAEGLALYDLPNNHLLHTLLVHLAADVLGPGVRALRLPAFLAGVLTVPATWAVGRRWHGRAAGLVAAAGAATSPVLVLFSTNARGYALVVLAFLVLALLAAELRRRTSPPLWAAFGGVAALAGWTMPAALYPVAAVGAWLLWPARPAEGAMPPASRAAGLAAASAAAAGAAALLYLPVLLRSGWRSVAANRFVRPDPAAEFLADVPRFLGSVLREWSHGVPDWVAALFLLGAVAAAIREATAAVADGGAGAAPADGGPGSGAGAGDAGRGGPPGGHGRRPSLLPAALVGSALVLAATRRAPFARVWLYLLPAFLVFAAAGLRDLAAALARRGEASPGGGARRAGRATAAAALAVLVGGGVHLLRSDPVASWGLTGSLPAGDRVAALLDRRMGPADAVQASLPSDAPLAYYFSRLGRDPARIDDVPAPGGCLWIVVNRRHGGDVPPATERLAGPPRRVRDFGGTVVYVAPAATAEPPDGPSAGGATDAARCPRPGGEAGAAATDSAARPPGRGGDEPPER